VATSVVAAGILGVAARRVLVSIGVESLVRRWADRNGYRVLRLSVSRFNLRSCRVVVEDVGGHGREARVVCGSWWGVLSEEVTVRWEDGGYRAC
jgi:hypothetical protein